MNGRAALIFAMMLLTAIAWGSYRLSRPEFYGVVKIEAQANAFELVNLRSGQHSEWRFCPSFRPPFEPGFVIRDIKVRWDDTRYCEDLLGAGANDITYRIVRGKDKEWWESGFGYLTYYDGDDRPVMALNCHNPYSDQTAWCDNGYAMFQGAKP